MRIKEKTLKELLPGKKAAERLDEHGAGVLLAVASPKGRIDFYHRVRTDGTDRTRKLGTYPEMSIAKAKEAARAAAKASLPVSVGTLADLLDAYLQSLDGKPSQRSARNMFKLAINERDPLRKREAASITTAEIATVLRRRAATGATTPVNRLRAYLHAAFAHAAKYDYDPRKPNEAATFGLAGNPVTSTAQVAEWERVNDRVLTDDELVDFWSKADAFGKAILLTGARLNQLAKAAFTPDTITITDTKGRGGSIKTCVLPVIDPDLFDGAAKMATAYVPDTLSRRIAALLPGDASPRDIRRTVETRLQALGVSRDLRGALLSHGQSGVQAKHYERAELLPEKRAALELWQAEILRLVSVANQDTRQNHGS